MRKKIRKKAVHRERSGAWDFCMNEGMKWNRFKEIVQLARFNEWFPKCKKKDAASKDGVHGVSMLFMKGTVK